LNDVTPVNKNAVDTVNFVSMLGAVYRPQKRDNEMIRSGWLTNLSM